MEKLQLNAILKDFASIMNKQFIHELPDAKELFERVSTIKASKEDKKILPIIVEKDYWLMHCLWGLQQQDYQFELKGGTSLSRGYDLIDRFSEDIDIQIYPKSADNIPINKNQDKPKHIEARRTYFDKLSAEFKIPGLTFKRDPAFDDDKFRSAGIRGEYITLFDDLLTNQDSESILKPGILLEVGFDQTTPNTACNISSWAYDTASTVDASITDNRALQVACYNPEYTFVEKLQTISTKYRKYLKDRTLPINFLRHYYDVYQLLGNNRVLAFIGTENYLVHKNKRFRSADEKVIAKNNAFTIPNPEIKQLFSNEFAKKSAMYFGNQPKFDEILQKIAQCISKL